MAMLLVIAATTAFLASVVATPLISKLAVRLGLVDLPDERVKLHRSPTPVVGGLVLALSSTVGLASSIPFFADSSAPEAGGSYRFLFGLGAAAVAIVVLGLVDDRVKLRGLHKLIGQILIACAMIGLTGFAPTKAEVFGASFALGVLAAPFALCWLLATINAMNLIDGMDGSASTVGVVIALGATLCALLFGHHLDSLTAVTLAAGLAGVLLFNFPPARVFLGDSGSMFLGLTLGALFLRNSSAQSQSLSLLPLLGIWVVPFFDIAMAIARRKFMGRSMYSADRWHLHHRLASRLGSEKLAVAALAGLSLLSAGGGVAGLYLGSDVVSLAASIAVIVVLVTSRTFGYLEFQVVLKSLENFITKRRVTSTVSANHWPAGDDRWEDLWENLTEFAQRSDLYSVEFRVFGETARETFAAYWAAPRDVTQRTWRVAVPVFFENRITGELRLAGHDTTGSITTSIAECVSGLSNFETQLSDILHHRVSDVSYVPAASGNGNGHAAASGSHNGAKHPPKRPMVQVASTSDLAGEVELTEGSLED